MNTIDSIRRLMQPRSVAVIGASADPSKTAGRPIKYLQAHGFEGEIYPVNPKATEIAGLTCYPDIPSLPTTPDVGVVLLGVERAHVAVRELAERGCAAAVVRASGYAETGPEGLARQAELLKAAGKMRIVGPNTIGVLNLIDKTVLSPTGSLSVDSIAKGKISVVSQSGGILGALLSQATARRC